MWSPHGVHAPTVFCALHAPIPHSVHVGGVPLYPALHSAVYMYNTMRHSLHSAAYTYNTMRHSLHSAAYMYNTMRHSLHSVAYTYNTMRHSLHSAVYMYNTMRHSLHSAAYTYNTMRHSLHSAVYMYNIALRLAEECSGNHARRFPLERRKCPLDAAAFSARPHACV